MQVEEEEKKVYRVKFQLRVLEKRCRNFAQEVLDTIASTFR